MNKMLREAQRMQEELAKAQAEAAKEIVEASAGGGMVTVKANGAGEIVEIAIDPRAIDPDDPELLADLVLAAEITPPEQVAQLEQLGVVVFWLANPTDFEGLYTNLVTVGQLTGHDLDAATLAESMRTRVSAVETAVAGISDRRVVFYEVDGLTDPNAPYTAGSETFIDLIINAAGGQNAAGTLEGYKQMSIEELLVQNPDFILLGDAAYGATPESVAQRAGWAELAAVQTNQVLPFDDNLMSRPGPRMIDAVEQLAHLLYPDLFN